MTIGATGRLSPNEPIAPDDPKAAPANRPAAPSKDRPKPGNFVETARADTKEYKDVQWKEEATFREKSQIANRLTDIANLLRHQDVPQQELKSLKNQQGPLAARKEELEKTDHELLEKLNKIDATFNSHVMNEIQIRHDRDPNLDIVVIRDSMIKELESGDIVKSVVRRATHEFIMQKLPPGAQRAQALVQEALTYPRDDQGKLNKMGKLNEYYRAADSATQKVMPALPGFKEIAKQEALSYFPEEMQGAYRNRQILADTGADILAELDRKMVFSPPPSIVLRFSAYPQEIQYAIKDAVAEIAGIPLLL